MSPSVVLALCVCAVCAFSTLITKSNTFRIVRFKFYEIFLHLELREGNAELSNERHTNQEVQTRGGQVLRLYGYTSRITEFRG